MRAAIRVSHLHRKAHALKHGTTSPPLELAHVGRGSGGLAVDGVAAKSICASTPSASAIAPMVSIDTLLRACSIEPMWER